ncbi:MAG TPA: ATP-binding protein [Chloroflexia bacterium]|nr:ATP-binding protein [Chloroflexia bacterium]
MSKTAPAGRDRAALGPGRRLLWSIPLGWQLSALYIVLLAVTLTLVGALVYTRQERFLVDDIANRLADEARRVMALPIGRQAQPGGFPGDDNRPDPNRGYPRGNASGPDGSFGPGDQTRLVTNLVHGLSGTDVTVAVLNSQGTVITATQGLEGDSARIVDRVTPQQAATALAGDQPLQWVVTRDDGSRQVVVLMRVVRPAAPDTAPGAAQTDLLLEQSASLAGVTTALQDLGTYLLLGVLGGTLAGIVLGLAFTRAVLRPLDQVADTADAIAAGDLQRRLQLPAGRNEVARLGKAFDYMVGRLVTTLEAQRRFVADASHELRTPLTSLKGLAEILVIGAHGNDQRVIEQAAGAINSELERLNRLVNDLLTLSRLDSAEGNAAPPVRRVRIDACATLQAAADQMAALAEGREVRLNQECAGPLWVTGDAGQLKQVLLNLLDNALRYTPPGGEVALRGRVDGAVARIEVQDTGVGIAAEDLAHIFERFYRGDASRTRATGNTGLGLAIVQTIVHAHGGEISVQSAPGAGTCFTITLPLAAAPVGAERPGAKSQRPA